MKIGVNEIKIGNILEHEGNLCSVIEREHIKPGKGGAYLQLKMRDIKNGNKINARLATSETVTRVRVEEMPCSVLYQDAEMITVMLEEPTYEQIDVNKSLIDDDKLPFFEDGVKACLSMHDGVPLSISLPATLIVKIAECEAVIKGQTVSSSYKPATLTNGARIMVPQFIQPETQIVINAETLEYLERVK